MRNGRAIKSLKLTKDNRNTLKRLLKLIFKTQPVWLFIAGVSIIISALATVIGSLFLKTLIDKYITPLIHQATPNFNPLIRVLLMMVGIYVIGTIATFIYTQIMAILAQRVQYNLRDEMFTHMQTLPVKYFDNNDYGDIMSHYTNDIDTLLQMVGQSLPQFLSSITNFIMVLIAMVIISWELTLFSLAIFASSIIIIKTLTSRSGHYFTLQQKSLGDLDGYAEEMLTGQKVVKVFSHEKEAEANFDKLNNSLETDSGNANGFATLLFPIIGNLGDLLYVLTAVFGGALAVGHLATLTLGDLAAFLQLSRTFSQPIAQISMQLNSIVQALAGAQRIFALLDQESETDNGTITLQPATDSTTHRKQWNWVIPKPDGSTSLLPLEGKITYSHVDFSYVPGKQILFDVSFNVNAGQKAAFVGETGAGKTTITDMLNRFYEIDSGTITYDDLDIRNIKKADLRHAMAIVLQDTHLFTGTVNDNIRYGRLDATDEEIQQAADLAQATDFINQLPDKFNTVITDDGGSLSAGQRQLLSIARAAIADPPVMILDEATSSIDTQTEKTVQTAMDNLMKGRTSLSIAHRLSTIYNADIIMVISGGKLIESGNHQQLMAQHGKYYQLYMDSFNGNAPTAIPPKTTN